MNTSDRKKYLKLILLFAFLGISIAAYFFDAYDYLSLSFVKEQLNSLHEYHRNAPLKSVLTFFGIYVLVTALSLPGAAVLTLFAGALFGSWMGLLVVSFASSLGALLSFFASRFILRDLFLHRFQRQFEIVNKNMHRDGMLYLATLRLVPVFPFFVVNIVMGLTSINAWTYYWVGQLTMLPGTLVYVYSGREFSQITSLKGILSPNIFLALVLLGTLPLLGKMLVSSLKRNHVYRRYKRPSVFDYNLVAIGGGSAGLVTAYIGAAVKSRVALIEREKMGGDCLNTGCVPSKAIIKSAKIVHLQHRSHEFGLSEISIKFDFASVMERVQRVVKEVEPHDSVERYCALGVECILGTAKILDPWTIEVDGKKITTKNMVIATGARPLVPDVSGIENVDFLTSDSLWKLRELPRQFVILGGGPIGVEMAQAFARLGSSVTLIEARERILSKEDAEVSSLITDVLHAEGVRILNQHSVKAFSSEGLEKKIICESAGKDITIPYDKVLIAIGRKPNVKGFGLEELGLKLRENGTIEVNEYLQTNFPNVYACGDVTGPFQLTHMASHQAWYCSVNSLFPLKFKVDYATVPWCTYTDPEVATVGETESTAREKGSLKIFVG
jgi:pyruvate/2-oxoglutarate dehydrogenase complex dihydrolipoamide dehydrogenase (E3) component/uncharacterized membrane protein YdjX (TVP38/TMEM64 family)